MQWFCKLFLINVISLLCVDVSEAPTKPQEIVTTTIGPYRAKLIKFCQNLKQKRCSFLHAIKEHSNKLHPRFKREKHEEDMEETESTTIMFQQTTRSTTEIDRSNQYMHPGWPCKTDADCAHINDTVCKLNKKYQFVCTCKKGFDEVDRHCSERILGKTCHPEDNPCPSNVYQCKKPGLTCTCGWGLEERDNKCQPLYEKFCESDKDCNSTMYNLRCSRRDKRCTCSNIRGMRKYRFNVQNGTLCGYSFGSTSECDKNKDCAAQYAKCMKNKEGQKKCVCATAQVDDLHCKQPDQNIGEFCNVKSDCMGEHLVCVEEKCTCDVGFKERDDKCIYDMYGRNCTNDAECSMNGTDLSLYCCKATQTCQCSLGHEEVVRGVCTIVYGKGCTSKRYCKGLANSDCSYEPVSRLSFCRCKKGFHFFNKTSLCGMPINEKCRKDKHCVADNSKCLNKLCQCKDNFAPTKDMDQCYKVPNKWGQNCKKKEDCIDSRVPKLLCSTKLICVCEKGYYYKKNNDDGDGSCQPVIDTACGQFDEICSNLPNAECNQTVQKCKCITGFNEKEIKGVKLCGKNSNEACETNSDCVIEGAICKRICTCPLDYDLSDEKCTPKNYLARRCIFDTDCDKPNSFCALHKSVQYKRCTCKRGYYYNGSACLNVLGKSCTEDTGCDGVPDSVCEGSKCVCRQWYAIQNGLCKSMLLRELNALCVNSDQCSQVNNSLCDYQSVGQITYNYAGTKWTNAVKFEKRCMCKIGYKAKDKTCIPVLGSHCMLKPNVNECPSPYAECIREVCTCKPEFIQRKIMCFSIHEPFLGKKCKATKECNIPFGECRFENGTKMCMCSKGHREENYECVSDVIEIAPLQIESMAIRVHWIDPNDDNVSHYEVHYKGLDDTEDFADETVLLTSNKREKEMVLPKLYPSTHYEICVRPIFKGDINGTCSKPTVIQTKGSDDSYDESSEVMALRQIWSLNIPVDTTKPIKTTIYTTIFVGSTPVPRFFKLIRAHIANPEKSDYRYTFSYSQEVPYVRLAIKSDGVLRVLLRKSKRFFFEFFIEETKVIIKSYLNGYNNWQTK